jgi:hypothetical protein
MYYTQVLIILPKPEVIPETVDISVSVDDGTDPVQGAIVTIGGKSCANGTGSGGGCTVKDVPVGEGVTVTVTCEGYEDYTATEDITTETTTLSITLTESVGGG